MSEYIYDESIQIIPTRVNNIFASIIFNAILEPHSFEDQTNVFKSIMKHRNLYEHFKIH